MNLHHHLDDATLVSHAAGALEPAMALVANCHMHYCEQCRERLAQGERLGAELVEHVRPVAMSPAATQALLELIEHTPIEAPSAAEDGSDWGGPGPVPETLRGVLAGDFDSIRWQPMAPGIRQAAVGTPGARLLRIAPGTSMPMHGHTGSELTLVLRGSYCDEIGRFRSGDIADLDPAVEHQPIADTDQPCICLIASDAPLKFRGFIPRMLQPFFGL